MLCSSCRWYLGYHDEICVQAPIKNTGRAEDVSSGDITHCPHYRKRKQGRSNRCSTCLYFSGWFDERCRAPRNPNYMFPVSTLGWGCPNYLKKGSLIGRKSYFNREHHKFLTSLAVALIVALISGSIFGPLSKIFNFFKTLLRI